MTLAPRLAAVGGWGANGVGFNQMDQAVFHESWFGEGCAAGEQLERVMRNATHFASSLRASACAVNASDVKLGGASRTAPAGSVARTFPRLCTRWEASFFRR